MNFQCKQTYVPKKVCGAILAGLILFSSLHVNAQEPITINSDNSVTITYIDPKAEKVEVQGTFFRPRPRHKRGKPAGVRCANQP